MYFAELLTGGLAIGCVYSLVALGFAMIIRATSIIHFAQGELLMLGSMGGLSTLWLMPKLPAVAVLVCGMLASGVLAVAMEFLVYRPLRLRRVALMNVITATVGMSILCINAARLIWGSEPLRYPELFSTSVYPIAGMMAGAAGVMFGSLFFSFFEMGFLLGIKGFVAATLGGLGSLAGAMLGGILFGLIETFSAVYVSSAYKDAIGMVLLIAILLFLPSGLVGLWKARG